MKQRIVLKKNTAKPRPFHACCRLWLEYRHIFSPSFELVDYTGQQSCSALIACVFPRPRSS